MLMLISALLAAAAPAPLVPGPVATVRQLLDGWRAADFAKASSALAADFRLTTLRKDGNGKRLEKDSRESLLTSMRALKPGQWDVRLGKMIVHQDATGIATVWAPYTFYMSGRKSHCGVESYTLYRLNEGWRIVEFADTHLWNGEEARCVDRPVVG